MSYTLLAVDDEPLEREVIPWFVSRLDLPVSRLLQASNGFEAVEKALASRPDLIIMDIRMPGKNGLEAAAEIREALPETVIVFLTAFDDFEYARAALRARAEDYLLKPISMEAFGEAMRRAFLAVDETRRLLSHSSRTSVIPDPVQDASGIPVPEPKDAPEPGAILVARVRDYLEAHYHEPINLDSVSRLTGLSRSHFCRMFKSVTGTNFSDCLTECRIRHSLVLLCDPALGIKEIGSRVGYSDPEYFATLFRKKTGMSPREYRVTHIPLA